MNLETALREIAGQLKLDAALLAEYAAEDTIGGYHVNPSLAVWKVGSLWEVEGKILYALVRALQAKTVVEIGSRFGCSAAHLATALRHNGGGKVIGVDLDTSLSDAQFPADLRTIATFVQANGVEWLATQEDDSIDLIFEDADHSRQTTSAVARLATKKLRPGGVLVVHDAMHDYAFVNAAFSRITSDAGAEIRAGLDMAAIPYRLYLIEPSDCGVAIYEKSTNVVVGYDDIGLSAVVDVRRPTEPAKERKPRKPRTSKKAAAK